MEIESNIKNQLKEEYGRVVYSYSTHQYSANFLLKTDKKLKILEIIVSALTTAGLLSLIAKYYLISTIVSTFLSISLIVISSLLKAGDYQLKASKHIQTANDLWSIREKYISLLTEFDKLNETEIKSRRDALLDETRVVYSYEERTDDKAYKRAQKALKDEEYQFFSKEELNVLLPEGLREKNNDK